MARTTQADLDAAAAAIADATGRDIAVRWAYGRPRLEERGGYRELSPRLPSGQLLDVLYGILQGIRLASPHRAYAETRLPRAGDTVRNRCQECGRPVYAVAAHTARVTWRHNPRSSHKRDRCG